MEEVDSTRMKEVDSTGMKEVDSTGMKEVDSTRMKEVDSTGMKEVDSTRMKEVDSTRMKEVDSTRMKEDDSTRMKEVDSTRMKQVYSTGMKEGDCTRMKEGDSTRMKEVDSTRMKEVDSTRMNRISTLCSHAPGHSSVGNGVGLDTARSTISGFAALCRGVCQLDSEETQTLRTNSRLGPADIPGQRLCALASPLKPSCQCPNRQRKSGMHGQRAKFHPTVTPFKIRLLLYNSENDRKLKK